MKNYLNQLIRRARTDRATFADSKQYPEGIDYVLVNGVKVIEKGEHTGAAPGMVVYGPGKKEPSGTFMDSSKGRAPMG